MYVISVKKTKDYKGRNIPKEVWRYAQYDDYSGSLSTGYPCFSDTTHAIHFESVEEAKKWYEKNKEFLSRYFSEYDMSTIAIREIIYNTVENL